ncbi:MULTISPECIES: FliM/FliN family flagellar motor switch protein [unclassified Serratia (in: enterobacteria)]|uniref:FliM/FliN family flagellar motor switch protein n=1 Tax=unclassified Serratia (in: enterobacteria) TaxID=2647522 RepID=UPI0005079CC7|nr:MULTISPECIES: FliM/FliN family flagellar motor switch protein [unclassified Serratia (in: enterobacteria)]KFK95363.1 flagellar motor switch protein FliM [Serratia sp. Ag2]KFK98711.1 flagellar motor switch protein FliM [Serratia sp. Ag1]
MQSVPQRIRIHHHEQLPDLVKLDVKKLGRPWHKLPKIMNDRFNILDAKLSIYFLKKFRVNVALKSMTFAADRIHRDIQTYSTPYGNLAFDIDRILLLDILHDYYGLSKDGNQIVPNISSPITKTEERLKNKLGHELTLLIINKETFGEDLELKNDYSTLINQWSWCITFTLEGYDKGNFTILLDQPHVDRMLSMLRSPDGEPSQEQEQISSAQIERLFYNLPLKLQGQVASLNLTVAQLADIEAGDIIPIALNEPVPVFIGNEQIYSAMIAEERGKLFLSEFNDKTIEKNYE